MAPLRRSSLVFLLAASASAFGCAQEDDNQDEAGAAELLERVQAADYRSWPRPPGFEERTASTRAHAQLVDLFVNEPIAELLDPPVSVAALPEGSIIIKDGYNDGALRLIAIMEKRSDGWFWAEYEADGTVTSSGHPDGCLKCHRAGKDFVRAFAVP